MTAVKDGMTRMFICGAALRGQPEHHTLESATFIGEAQTIPRYRLHAAGKAGYPAMYEVKDGGISIPGELYEVSSDLYTQFLDKQPANFYPGEVVLTSAEMAVAMLYPRDLVERFNWPDISHYGSWVAYKTHQQTF
jgi:gamma-glutamylcyclotransferase (GGCT)/AIG2-like uncharacterized protein YtfP